tara:strand:- start:272 stop:430 length:159 start_codon:yes stop_codon:yes gene_type:complete
MDVPSPSALGQKSPKLNALMASTTMATLIWIVPIKDAKNVFLNAVVKQERTL